jgi:hypothetical protein
MPARRVRCPKCDLILDVPEEYSGTKVLCSACDAQLVIPAASDAEILDWIGKKSKEDTASALAVEEVMPASAQETETAGPRDNLPADEEGLVLVHIDKRGAMFEFPAERLEDADFRSALPRRCLRCGVRHHLQTHLVIFSHQMKDCSEIESDFLEQRPMLTDREIRNLAGQKLLDRLPAVPRVPAPADKPMPYWTCDMCSPANMIFAQHEIDPKTHTGHCHIQIRRLWRAQEFLHNAGGGDSEADREIVRQLKYHPETDWDSLPGVVQQRLRQWFKPLKNERFVAYMPDRTHSRTEDGMAGVVITNRRLIYNSSMRHRESEKGEPLDLEFSMESGRLHLNIKGPNWEIKNIIADKAGLACLRRALSQQKFTAVWH